MAIALPVIAGEAPKEAATFVEEFSLLVNGADGTMAGQGAKRNGWSVRVGEYWKVNTDKDNLVLSRVMNHVSYWDNLGKAHGLPVGKATHLELSFDCALSGNFASALVWFADTTQNGYGITASYINYDYARIAKLRGSITGFGTIPEWTHQWGDQYPAPPAEAVQCGLHNKNMITYHMRLEQEAAGQPVRVTFWFTGSAVLNNELFKDQSYDQPAVTWTDDGTAIGKVIDLRTLTHIGITAQNTPEGDVRLDNIRVKAW
jgi:hypothetical protein